jgi:hypothetical protein
MEEINLTESPQPIVKRGRPAKGKSLAVSRERITGMPTQGRSLGTERRVNSKPNREVDSLSRGRTSSMDNSEDAQYNFTGFHVPPVVIKRMDREGYKLAFFLHDKSLQQIIPQGWRPVRLAEVPEISLNIVPNLPGVYADESSEYFIYADQILMKIKKEDWQRASTVTRQRLEGQKKIVQKGQNKFGNRTGIQEVLRNPRDRRYMDYDGNEDGDDMGADDDFDFQSELESYR